MARLEAQKKEDEKISKELRAKAKASSKKIVADKKKKQAVSNLSNLSALPFEGTNVENVADPESLVGTFFRDAESNASQVTLLDTTPRGLVAIGITPIDLTPGSEHQPIDLDATMVPNEPVDENDEPMPNAMRDEPEPR